MRRVKTWGRRVLPKPLVFRVDLATALRAARRRAAERSASTRRPNPLPGQLIVSLTSFPPRFKTLHLTLKSLLDQSVTADRIYLWIAEQDLPLLPRKVRSLERRGIAIRACEDIGSYKKLIYALEEHPDAFIVTADDDTFYDPRWLEEMVAAADGPDDVIVCHRAHRIARDQAGGIAAYAKWPMDVRDEAARSPSSDLLPTGCGGILYPPRCLSEEVLDRNLFRSLCPTADDLWFYWMAARAGTKVMKVGGAFPMIQWPSARISSLWDVNRLGENDRQIRNLERAFGVPPPDGPLP